MQQSLKFSFRQKGKTSHCTRCNCFKSTFLYLFALILSFSLPSQPPTYVDDLHLTPDLTQHLSPSHCHTLSVSHMAESHVSRVLHSHQRGNDARIEHEETQTCIRLKVNLNRLLTGEKLITMGNHHKERM